MMHALVRGGGAGGAAPGASTSRDGAGAEFPHNRMAKAAAEEEEEQRSGGDTTDTVGRMRERGDSHASWALGGFSGRLACMIVVCRESR
jgi:hypothetical protein